MIIGVRFILVLLLGCCFWVLVGIFCGMFLVVVVLGWLLVCLVLLLLVMRFFVV